MIKYFRCEIAQLKKHQRLKSKKPCDPKNHKAVILRQNVKHAKAEAERRQNGGGRDNRNRNRNQQLRERDQGKRQNSGRRNQTEMVKATVIMGTAR